ncbi:hypothetical protein LTR78_004882 [Recurvomyces mirabilis]|uniref:tRNA (adenine(58)-N(1))-methyltransferase catalytic subunit TRM61 n=1 Tax=Recurvomyces mirabilis TaxID=574656 RepID=A0AAE0WP87_9PEZI|nr:hypothetical protein LTR78_004882 [Recurvomyces mirabilis]KAK5158052.1 hypothetical protein LTS14_003975 [Recurvomyces mirabilis]
MLRTCRLPSRQISYQPHRHISNSRHFAPGDHVLLRSVKDRTAAPLLTKPLTPGHKHDTHRGPISHNDILGKTVRDVVSTTAGKLAAAEYRLHEVKLEEYVRLTRRLVTPLYPQDAQLIVNLLDLHPEPPRYGGSTGNGKEDRLEILEAGTGHGALTLHLSRAIHAANPPLPRHIQKNSSNEEEDHNIALSAWKSTRNAIIHTIELNPKYSTHAQKIVRGFRHGMYAHNIDFHIGSVSEWITSALASPDRNQNRKGEPFLSHAFLDLPGTEDHLATVAKALRVDGALVVFCPSITQIMTCFETVKAGKIPLDLDKVVELGVNGGSGGREWDVRLVRPRGAASAGGKKVVREAGVVGGGEVTEGEVGRGEGDSGVDVSEGIDTKSTTPSTPPTTSTTTDVAAPGLKMVCRPKVGEMIVGGGFLGVFRKKRQDS